MAAAKGLHFLPFDENKLINDFSLFCGIFRMYESFSSLSFENN
jgi:hypothetical protein